MVPAITGVPYKVYFLIRSNLHRLLLFLFSTKLSGDAYFLRGKGQSLKYERSRTGEDKKNGKIKFQELWSGHGSKENPVCKQQTLQMLYYIILGTIFDRTVREQ